MKITNKYNLPEAIYQACCIYNRKPVPDRFSVTELIDSPYIRHLKMIHWEEIEEDASDRLWALLGSVIHAILEKTEIENSLQEEKLKLTIDKYTITGKVDLYHDKTVHDYKITSYTSYLYGIKQEWINQLNVYAYMYKKYGFKVDKLQIHAIFRDWNKNKALRENLPEIPFCTYDIPLWTEEKQLSYIKHRLIAHTYNSHNSPLHCTPEERWAKPTTYALMDTNRKRAKKIYTDMKETPKILKSSEYIERREGEHIRCKHYCPVRKFCQIKLTDWIKLEEG